MKRLMEFSFINRDKKSRNDSSSFTSSDGRTEDNVSEKEDVKRKSRNLSEKKRRDQFNALINELFSILNFDKNDSSSLAVTKKMDKLSILRTTIVFLKNHIESNVGNQNATNNFSSNNNSNYRETYLGNKQFCQNLTCQKDSWKPSFLSLQEFSYLMLEALDAFVLAFEIDHDGRIIYASESILPLLGLNASDLIASNSSNNNLNGTSKKSLNTSIYDLIHKMERNSLRKAIADGYKVRSNDTYITMMVHFKSYSEQSSPHSKANNYQLIKISGTFQNVSTSRSKMCFICICRLQIPKLVKELYFCPSKSSNSISSKNNEFISRHSLEWKFIFLDHQAPTIIGYLPFEVLGTSGYDYYHWDDLDLVVAGHQQMIQTGGGTSCHYRFLTKGHQWIWLQTRYFITYHMWNSKPEFIVCTHTVIGYDEIRQYSRPKTVKEWPYNSNICQSNNSITSSQSSFDSNSSQMCSNWASTNLSLEATKSEFFVSEPSSSSIKAINNYDQPVANASFSTAIPKMSQEHLSSPFSSLIINSSCLNDQKSVYKSSVSDCSTNQSTIINEKIETSANCTSAMLEAPSQLPTTISNPNLPSSISDLQEFLRVKHNLLRGQIFQQQEELQRVSEQLMMVEALSNHSNQIENLTLVSEDVINFPSTESSVDQESVQQVGINFYSATSQDTELFNANYSIPQGNEMINHT